MTIKNLPILYLNIMDGLPTEIARDALLWATERPENDHLCYVAEKFAHEVAHLDSSLWYLVRLGGAQHGLSIGGRIDLHAFMLRRHAHFVFPDAKQAWI